MINNNSNVDNDHDDNKGRFNVRKSISLRSVIQWHSDACYSYPACLVRLHTFGVGSTCLFPLTGIGRSVFVDKDCQQRVVCLFLGSVSTFTPSSSSENQ